MIGHCAGCGIWLSAQHRENYGDFCLECSRKRAEANNKKQQREENSMFGQQPTVEKRVLSEAHKKAISEGRKRAYTKRKGKWSAEAKQRLRDRIALKNAGMDSANAGALTITQRLDLIESQVKHIRTQLGGMKHGL